MSGWYSMARGWADNPVFMNEVYSRRDAWVWMIERACWQSTKFDIRGKTITLERGQFCASIRQMADAWKWSKSAVQRYCARLETDTMIGTQSGTGKLVVTICNYEKYQSPVQFVGTQSGIQSGTAAGQQRDTKEQENNITREKNYHWEGKFVRLNAADFTRWQQAFHGIPDYPAELQRIDDCIAGMTPADHKRWFMIASAMLAKKHQAAIVETKAATKPDYTPQRTSMPC